MKKIFYIFLCLVLFQMNLEGKEMKNQEELNSIKVVLYYNNPSLYTDVKRTFNDVINGKYEIKKEFFIDDLKEFDSLEKLFSIKPSIRKSQESAFNLNSYVTSICVIYINTEKYLSFSYDESDGKYCICNDEIIERNTIYDSFVRYLINKISPSK